MRCSHMESRRHPAEHARGRARPGPRGRAGAGAAAGAAVGAVEAVRAAVVVAAVAGAAAAAAARGPGAASGQWWSRTRDIHLDRVCWLLSHQLERIVFPMLPKSQADRSQQGRTPCSGVLLSLKG